MKVLIGKAEESILAAMRGYIDHEGVTYFMYDDFDLSLIPERGPFLLILGNGSTALLEKIRERNKECLALCHGHMKSDSVVGNFDGFAHNHDTEKSGLRDLVFHAIQTDTLGDLEFQFPDFFDD